MSYTVYKHTSPSGKVYIGITATAPEQRWGQGGYKYRKNAHFYAAIQKYGWGNIRHEILAEGLTRAEACSAERILIAQHDSTNPEKGYNHSTGGESGTAGVKHTSEARQKISEAVRGERHPLYGKHHSEETRLKISKSRRGKLAGADNPNYGRPLSEKTKQKLSAANKGRFAGEKHPLYGRPSVRRRPVFCIETGSTYPSVRDAGEQTKIGHPSIAAACKGKRKTAGGYHWMYAEGVTI